MRMFRRFLIASLAILFLIGCRGSANDRTETASPDPKPVAESTAAAEPHVHDWEEATCTAPKTCRVCGAAEGEPLGHDFREATCTEPKTCTRCGFTEGEPMGHDFQGASCTAPGICSRCGAEGDPQGHDWFEACTLPKTCRRCGLTEGEAPGHRMENGVCSQCDYTVFEPIKDSGNAVLTDIGTGNGIYRVHFSHAGECEFTVWSYDASGSADLLLLKKGRYDGSALLFGEAPFTFEIFARSDWELTIEQLDLTADTAFSGTADGVTDLCMLRSGVFRFTHTGENDFVVWMYTTDGETLLIRTQGPCAIEQTVTVPEGSFAFFAVRADAAWTIERIGDPE